MTLKVLHAGAGGWGGKWCREYLPRAVDKGLIEVVGLIDLDPIALKQGRQALGLASSACHTDMAEAFRSTKADFCSIAIPPAHHESVVNLAVKAGLNILSEKPIADTIVAAVRIVKQVKDAGLKMGVTMSHRYDQDKQTLASIVRSGHLGKLNSLHCRLSADFRILNSWRPFRHQMAHPLLVEGAVHHLDVLESLAGAPSRTVYAATWRPEWAEYTGDSDGTVVITYENGVHATFEGSHSSPVAVSDWGHEQIRADGSEGIAVLDHREVELFRRVHGAVTPKDSGFDLGQRGRYGHGQKFPLTSGDVWLNDFLIERFVAWMKGGPEMETHAQANLRSLATVFAAIESTEKGQAVDMREFCARHAVA